MPDTQAKVDFYPALIGGERVHAASRETIDATNPANGELIGRFPRCGAEDVSAAVEAADTAFHSWSRTDPRERADLLHRLADALSREAEEFALLDSLDNGSTLRMMRGDVAQAIEQTRFFAGMALQVTGDTLPTLPGRLNYSLRQPFGVVGRIIPFNHPLMFAMTRIAAPLVVGNTVVLKPSEHTSLTALRLAGHIAEIFPSGVVNIVPGLGGEAGDALVTHPDVRRLAFTGSAEIGRAIQGRAASAGVKSVTLELGGKNPLVVFPDADVELALDGAVRGMNFLWQGQSCGSTSRLLVHRDLHDDFVKRLVERISGLRSAMPQDETADIGAIVNRAQYEKVERYVALGTDEGASLLTGGEPPSDPELAHGLFMRPAVFDHVRPDSRLAQEEIFGPVLAVLTFDDYDDAVRIANGVGYGLTAAVFTRDLATAHAFARDAEAGYVWVNDSSRHFLGAPFGGFKDSGVGREESLHELEGYTQLKNVHVRYEDAH